MQETESILVKLSRKEKKAKKLAEEKALQEEQSANAQQKILTEEKIKRAELQGYFFHVKDMLFSTAISLLGSGLILANKDKDLSESGYHQHMNALFLTTIAAVGFLYFYNAKHFEKNNEDIVSLKYERMDHKWSETVILSELQDLLKRRKALQVKLESYKKAWKGQENYWLGMLASICMTIGSYHSGNTLSTFFFGSTIGPFFSFYIRNFREIKGSVDEFVALRKQFENLNRKLPDKKKIQFPKESPEEKEILEIFFPEFSRWTDSIFPSDSKTPLLRENKSALSKVQLKHDVLATDPTPPIDPFMKKEKNKETAQEEPDKEKNKEMAQEEPDEDKSSHKTLIISTKSHPKLQNNSEGWNRAKRAQAIAKRNKKNKNNKHINKEKTSIMDQESLKNRDIQKLNKGSQKSPEEGLPSPGSATIEKTKALKPKTKKTKEKNLKSSNSEKNTEKLNDNAQFSQEKIELLTQGPSDQGKLIDSKETSHSFALSSSDISSEEKSLPPYTHLPEYFSLANLKKILTTEMRKSLTELIKLKTELDKFCAIVYLHGSFVTKCYAHLLTGKNLQAGDIDVVIELPEGLSLNDLLEKIPLGTRAFGFERVQPEIKSGLQRRIPQSCNFVSKDDQSLKIDLVIREAGYIPNFDPFDFSNTRLNFIADEREGIYFFPDKLKLEEISEYILSSQYPVQIPHPSQRNIRNFIPRFAKYLARYTGEMEIIGYFYDNYGKKWNLSSEDLEKELINYFRNLFEIGMSEIYWHHFSGMEKIIREGNFTHPAARKIILPFCVGLLATAQEPGQCALSVIQEDLSEDLHAAADNMLTILQSYFAQYSADAKYFKLITDHFLVNHFPYNLSDSNCNISEAVKWLKKSVNEKLPPGQSVPSLRKKESLSIQDKGLKTKEDSSDLSVSPKETRSSYLRSNNPNSFYIKKAQPTDASLKIVDYSQLNPTSSGVIN